MAIKNQLKTAKWAQPIWRDAITKEPRIEEYFHLRANSGTCTLVTTHEKRRLNGKSGLGKMALPHILDEITKLFQQGDKITAILDVYIPQVSHISKKEAELQATIIRDWDKFSHYIKKALDFTQLTFVTTEFIMQEESVRGGQRADIVAYGRNAQGKDCIVLIELKTLDNKKDDPIEQVKKYLQKYKPMAEFYTLMADYPIKTHIAPEMGKTDVIGLAVRGYSEYTDGVQKTADSNIYELNFRCDTHPR